MVRHCASTLRDVYANVLISLRGGTKYARNSAGVLAPLILGIGLLAAFLFIELKVSLPIIPSESALAMKQT